ncbi:MAG TPA: hypothetical protein VEY33_07790, partial [Gemmatimonadota bacterium]|nr:hypothetical protein [Gemmatimonadota bacterium]
YDAKVKVLKDLVDHHVEEEEGQMMPKAKKLLSSEELEALGTQVESRKEELTAAYAEELGKAGGAASGRQKAAPSRGASSSRSSAGKGASSSSVEASRSPRPARRRPASGAIPSPAKSKTSRKK